MRREELFDAITNVGDALVDGAAQAKPGRGKARWLKLGGIAAVFAVAIGLGAGALHGAIPLLPEGLGPGGNAAGSGHDGGSAFMSYAGPVFPLTALEGGQGLTAERALTYDFSPWTPVWHSNEEMAREDAQEDGTGYQEALDQYEALFEAGGYYETSHDLLVTDSYTLTNPTGEDRAVRLLYPFASSLWELSQHRPALTADGAALDTTLHAGVYSGAFQGAVGAEDQETGSVNLKGFDSWESYKALLESGEYQAQALDGFPDLSRIQAAVYRFTNAWGPERESGVTNPSIHAAFSLDYDETTVLSYGFHGGCWDQEAGIMDQSFSIPEPGRPDSDSSQYLIVLGEAPSDFQVFATSSGAPEAKEDLEFGVEAGVTVERYETDLDSALRTVAQLMYDGWYWEGERPDFELYFGLMKLDMAAYGPLSFSSKERYSDGWLAEGDFAQVSRVFYLETQITVPAGGSVTVEAAFTKAPSYDYYCARTDSQGVYGYDMVTRLGAGLDFTALTARAVNTEYTEIVRQNYGFDWNHGVSAVALDLDTEHYYLEVRQAADESPSR